MLFFSFTGSVELRITMLDGTFTECKVLPSSYGIEPITNGHSVSFFLDRPRKISVEFDNDITHALLIFADEPEENVPSQEDPDVLYFGPGIHDLEEPISPISGQTVYIAGGAIVKGLIEAENVSNVTVRGRGILDGRKYGHTHGRHIYFKGQNAFGISIEGITIVDSPGYMLTSQVRNTQVIFKH